MFEKLAPKGYSRLKRGAWLLAATIMLAGLTPTPADAATKSVFLSPLDGSTGGKATSLLREDLGTCGRLRMVDEPGEGLPVVSGTSVSGRVEGKLVDSSGKEIFSRSYASPNFRENIHMFADDIVYELTGHSGISGSLIAFVGEKTGSKEIYMTDYDGRNVAQITRNKKVNISPSISPDGLFIAHSGYASGYADIYLVDLGTGRSERIVNAPGANLGAAVSPGAQRLALTMSFTGNPELYVTGVASGRGQRLTDSPGVEADPAWSPDGKKLVFVSDQGKGPKLFLVDLEEGKPRELVTGYRHNTAPDWSPDGERIVFNTRVKRNPAIAMYYLNTGKAEVFRHGVSDPCWGPDGRHLAYCEGGSLIIEDIDLPSSKRRKRTVVSEMGRVSEPSWTR